MAGKVLVIFDSLSIREEAVIYAVELAKRMKYSIYLLILLESDEGKEKDAEEVERTMPGRALQNYLEFARQNGILAEGEVRVGSPNSELMKFMAESRCIQAIVWGGCRKTIDPRLNKTHWFNRIKEMIRCPVVVPLRKPSS